MKERLGRTTFVIAHRLSTIRNADKIIVMGKGQIIEEGNHESLIQLEGTYCNLVRQQALQTEENEEMMDDHEKGRNRSETVMSAVSSIPGVEMVEDESNTKKVRVSYV